MYEQGCISGRELDESVIDMEYQHTEKMNDFCSQIRSMTSQLKANIHSWEMSYVLMSPIDGKITFKRISAILGEQPDFMCKINKNND